MSTSKYFIRSLKPKLWKLVPLREQHDLGEEVFLYDYTRSLVKDLMGGLETYPDLEEDAYYISIVNTVQFLNKYTTSFDEWRSEVFKTLNLLKKILASNYAQKGG